MKEPRNEREAHAILARTTEGWREHAEQHYRRERAHKVWETVKLYGQAALLMGAVYLIVWVSLAI